MTRTVVGRLGVSAAVAAAALAGVLAAPGTAGATAQTRCWWEGGFSWEGSGILGAYLFWECIGPESVTPGRITLQRYTPETDTWTTVATGRGRTNYHCIDTSSNYFHMTAMPDDFILVDCF